MSKKPIRSRRCARATSWIASLALAAIVVGFAPTTLASAQQFSRLKTEIGLDPRLDQEIPRDLAFRDETGKEVRIGDYFGHAKPVVLVLVYFECPMLCTQVLNGFVRTQKAMSLKAGDDFDIVTVSINPRETPELALAKKACYIETLGNPKAAAGWHFLTTSDDATIHRLADSIGFHYFYDEEIQQYGHPGVLTLLTPDAKISRYFSDVEFSPLNLRLALVEASDGEIGSWTDHILLRCYHYDPTTGKYGLVITNIIRFLSFLTVATLGGFLFVMVRRDRRARVPVMP